jgi:hypothetical protein
MRAFFTPQLKRNLKILLLAYAVIGIAGYYLQDYLILHPAQLAPDAKYAFPQPFEEINWQIDEKTSFHIVQFPVSDSIKKGVVLYFHGNLATKFGCPITPDLEKPKEKQPKR